MLNYKRSGGTLLNKCLGTLPNTVVMSEVNPMGGGWGKEKENSHTTIKDQAKYWYGIHIESNSFRNNVLELAEKCEQNGATLILRDYSRINFEKNYLNNFTPPNKFMILESLKGLLITAFGFIRDPIDIWISSGMPPINEFFNDYFKYVSLLNKINIPIYKYEDFCDDPSKFLILMCKDFKLKYIDVTRTYHNFKTLNGDTQSNSRGSKKNIIRPLKRKAIPSKFIVRLNNNEHLAASNILMGYNPYYNSKEIAVLEKIKLEIKEFRVKIK